jgi:hypothetical protein
MKRCYQSRNLQKMPEFEFTLCYGEHSSSRLGRSGIDIWMRAPRMSEKPMELDKAEFERIARDLADDTYTVIGKCISTWAKSEGVLIYIAAMLLDTSRDKAGLVFYSINNFHTWLSIIDELFAMDPQYSPLRPDWIEISNRLKKLNDTRVRLAHHTLGPGMDFEQFVASGGTDPSAIFPTLKPNKSDSRTKSKKHIPLGMEGLTKFAHEMDATIDKIIPLIERMAPIFGEPKQRLIDTIKQFSGKAGEAQRGKS